MKRIGILGLTSALAFCSAFAQEGNVNQDVEGLIRKLDAQEREAVFKQDFAAVDRLWAPDLVVNNPENRVVKASSGPMRTAAVKHTLFNREVESIQIHGDTVIVMGREEVISEGSTRYVGQLVRRRFTNVWMKREGEWRLTARHASVICPDADDAVPQARPQ